MDTLEATCRGPATVAVNHERGADDALTRPMPSMAAYARMP